MLRSARTTGEYSEDDANAVRTSVSHITFYVGKFMCTMLGGFPVFVKFGLVKYPVVFSAHLYVLGLCDVLSLYPCLDATYTSPAARGCVCLFGEEGGS